MVGSEPRPVPWTRILRVWLGLSMLSFGGGVATLALIRRAAVDQEKWVSDLEFTRYWALCQVTPGINLFALTILIGRKTAGAAGVAAALAGLLFPSVTITILMTALYAHMRTLPAMQAAVHGLLPATIGLGLVATFQMVRPLVTEARKEGVVSSLVFVTALVGSGGLVAVGHVPVVGALLLSGVLCALHGWVRSVHTSRESAQ